MSPLKIRPDIAALEESKIVEVWRMGFDIPDVIGMWVGQGDLPTPRFICDAAANAMAAGDTFYWLVVALLLVWAGRDYQVVNFLPQ